MNNHGVKVVIAGAGPAGSSLAIRLATAGRRVTLVEREKFPRHKLCGEFISPECLAHFEKLGVRTPMLSAGGERIGRTRFYEPGGRFVEVPSAWLEDGERALSLSRAEMDSRLLDKARSLGVEVLEETRITGFTRGRRGIEAVDAKNVAGDAFRIGGDIFVDATGRARVLARLLEKDTGAVKRPAPGLVGFKAHFADAAVPRDVCEIYSFPGGYGGLSPIEAGLANFCFLVRSEIVQKFGGDACGILNAVVFHNARAADVLADARIVHDWLAVSVDAFGIKGLTPAPNVFTVGDAGAFIDPFTGSGMLLALQGSDLLAELITAQGESGRVVVEYPRRFRSRFARRLLVSSALRRVAYSPAAARTLITALGHSSTLLRLLARTTRGRVSREA